MGGSIGKIVLGVVALLAGIAGGVYLNYQHSFSNVAFNVDKGLQVSIYQDLGGDSPSSFNSNSQPIVSFSSNQTARMKQGLYDAVVADPNHQYANPVTKFQVTIGNNSVTISPTFTTQKLADLLASERPQITQALDAKYPSLPGLYTISADRLYEHGDWYGAVLTPSGPGYDAARVILHEEGGVWVVATDPPQISIGEPSNPSIPADVIDDLDQM